MGTVSLLFQFFAVDHKMTTAISFDSTNKNKIHLSQQTQIFLKPTTPNFAASRPRKQPFRIRTFNMLISVRPEIKNKMLKAHAKFKSKQY